MSFKKVLTSLSIALLSFSAKASFIDTDTYCVNYGCVVVSDNNTSDVYDVYNYTGTSTVPVGGQLNDYGTNPIEGSGTVDPMFTNTNTNVSIMAANQGNRLQVSNQVGGGVFTYPASGLLDASTTLTKFGIQSATKIDYTTPGAIANLGDNPQSHSFYITSRNVKFNIRATATLASSSNEFPTNVPGGSIGILLTLTPSGTVAGSGQLFGTNTVTTYQFSNVTGLDLADLSTNPIVGAFDGTNIYSTANATATIYTKSVRLNAVYTLPAFSLSQGRGDMRWNINYSFWRK
jgi:hypothetical protein